MEENFTMKNLSEYLSSEYSWWELNDDNELQPLNEVTPTKENVRIIFRCDTCSADRATSVHHVAEVKELKKCMDGDFDACCYLDENGQNQRYLSQYEIPSELQEIFDSTTFESNY